MMDAFLSADQAVRGVLSIATVGVIIATIEDLHFKEIFSQGGLLSWDVLRLSSRPARARPWRSFLDWVNEPKVFESILRMRLAVSVLLLATLVMYPEARAFQFPLVLFIFLSLLSLNFRAIYGLDGAHHMMIVIFLSANLFFVASDGSFAAKACVLFIGAQAIISYVISGLAKCFGRSWRNGEALVGIMLSRIYGHERLGRFLARHPHLSKALGWGVIAFECSFFLALIASPELLGALLIGGLLFHASAALFMGLNGFFFAFVATYPAVIYLNHQLQLPDAMSRSISLLLQSAG